MGKNSHYSITILPKTVEKKLIAVETVDFTENGRSTAKTVVVGRSDKLLYVVFSGSGSTK